MTSRPQTFEFNGVHASLGILLPPERMTILRLVAQAGNRFGLLPETLPLTTAPPEVRSGKEKAMSENEFNGAPERIRTSDPQIRSLVLYPAELRARGGPGGVACRTGRERCLEAPPALGKPFRGEPAFRGTRRREGPKSQARRCRAPPGSSGAGCYFGER